MKPLKVSDYNVISHLLQQKKIMLKILSLRNMT